MIGNYFGTWGAKEFMPAEVMGTPKLYRFADTQFYGAADADQYLRMLYGDYMQLPPEDKRHIHMQKIWQREEGNQVERD